MSNRNIEEEHMERQLLGAKAMSDWTVYRIAGDTLKELSK